jgi:hypothetical protein
LFMVSSVSLSNCHCFCVLYLCLLRNFLR